MTSNSASWLQLSCSVFTSLFSFCSVSAVQVQHLCGDQRSGYAAYAGQEVVTGVVVGGAVSGSAAVFCVSALAWPKEDYSSCGSNCRHGVWCPPPMSYEHFASSLPVRRRWPVYEAADGSVFLGIGHSAMWLYSLLCTYQNQDM